MDVSDLLNEITSTAKVYGKQFFKGENDGTFTKDVKEDSESLNGESV